MKIIDLKYLLAYLMPFSAFLALKLGSYWSFSTVILGFLIIPILEYFIKPNLSNIDKEIEQGRTSIVFFDYILYLNIPILYFLIFYTVQVLQTDLSILERIGFLLNIATVMATTGINVAHEIGHRKGIFNQLCAAILLIPSWYGHFTTEHNYGHHKWVATPDDPATAKVNQNVYSFIFSAVKGVFFSAWKISSKNLDKKGLPKWHFSNELIWITIAQTALFGFLFFLGGWFVLVFFIAAAILSFSLLEAIDYVEHYGLTRKKLDSGNYERVNEKHSWNSEHEVGRIFLYELTRHTDHHISSNKKYQLLQNLKNSPQLPFGYPTAILTALIPSLWFKKMNPLVKLYNN